MSSAYRRDTVSGVTDRDRSIGGDPVVDAYKPGIDRTLLIESLERTPEDRLRNLMALQSFADELRRAGREAGRPR